MYSKSTYNGYNITILDNMRKLEIDDIEAMIEKTINEDGRIWGLKEWKKRKAIIIIPKENENRDNKK